MKRNALFLATILVVFGVFAGTALAAKNDWPAGLPAHGHALLLTPEVIDEFEDGGVTFWVVAYDRCVELAAGAPLRGTGHHDSVHTGAAGGSPFAPGALWFKAGHAVVPLQPLTPWAGCDEILNPFVVPAP